MITVFIRKRCSKDEVNLVFDGLLPNEAHKLMDCLFDPKMDEHLMMEHNVDLLYEVTGYGDTKDGEKTICKDIVLFIKGSKENEGHLKALADIILDETGLKAIKDY